MKNYYRWIPSLILVPPLVLLILAFTNGTNSYRPILMTRGSLESAVQWRETREIQQPGKIWVYNQFIFVIEQYRGIHVIDNTDTTSPKKLGFIQIDGCTDVAVKSGRIYANNAVDLICIKPDPVAKSMTVLSRNRNVLPELSPPDGAGLQQFSKNRPEGTIIVRYEPN